MNQIDLPTGTGWRRRYLSLGLGAALALCAGFARPCRPDGEQGRHELDARCHRAGRPHDDSRPCAVLWRAGARKNVLSVFMQVFICFCIISILWVVYGYSLAFTANGAASLTPFIGGLSKAMLAGVDPNTMVATFSKETFIPGSSMSCSR